MRHGSATREMSRAARRTKTTKTATTPSPRTKACHQVRASITTTSAPTAASRGRNMTRLSVRSRPRVFSVCSRLVCSGFVGALTPPPRPPEPQAEPRHRQRARHRAERDDDGRVDRRHNTRRDMGSMVAEMMRRSGSIWPAVAVHTVNNLALPMLVLLTATTGPATAAG
ncbi:hypothetical protein ACFQGX_39055 [Nonomuraea dietziae]